MTFVKCAAEVRIRQKPQRHALLGIKADHGIPSRSRLRHEEDASQQTSASARINGPLFTGQRPVPDSTGRNTS